MIVQQQTPYREMEGINQSFLKKLADGPFIREDNENAAYFILGQLVEDMYMGSENAKNYVVLDLPGKNTNLGKFAAEVLLHWQSENEFPPLTVQEAIYNRLGIKSPKFPELQEQSDALFQHIQDTDWSVAITVDRDMLDKANRMVLKLQGDPHVTDLLTETPTKSVMAKVPITWNMDHNGQIVTCKAELDFLVIDHDRRTLQIVDLKTTGSSVYDFRRSFFGFRYDIQASYYMTGLEYARRTNPEYAEYEVLGPLFVVVDDSTPTPLIFKPSAQTREQGKVGFMDPYGNQVPGWSQLLSLYLFYEQYGYEYPKEVFDKGYITL